MVALKEPSLAAEMDLPMVARMVEMSVLETVEMMVLHSAGSLVGRKVFWLVDSRDVLKAG